MNITVDTLKQMLFSKLPLIALIDGGILYGGIPGFGHFIVSSPTPSAYGLLELRVKRLFIMTRK